MFVELQSNFSDAPNLPRETLCVGFWQFKRYSARARPFCPFQHDLAVDLHLVEVIAAQAFVADVRYLLEHELACVLQRLKRFLFGFCFCQDSVTPPPDLLRWM